MDENIHEIFWTFDIKIVKKCQLNGGFLPIEYRNDIQQIKFRNNFVVSNNDILFTLTNFTVPFEIAEIAHKYIADQRSFKVTFAKTIYNCFRNEVLTLYA